MLLKKNLRLQQENGPNVYVSTLCKPRVNRTIDIKRLLAGWGMKDKECRVDVVGDRCKNRVFVILSHLHVIAWEDAGSGTDHAGPRMLSDGGESGCREVRTYHQSLVLSVFFVMVMISPFLKPRSPG